MIDHKEKCLHCFRNKRHISLFTSSKWSKSNRFLRLSEHLYFAPKLAFLNDPVVEKKLITSEITVSALLITTCIR